MYKTRLLHTLLFFVITYVSIKSHNDKNHSDSVIVDQSIYASLVFFFLSSTEFHSLTRQLTGSNKLGDGNCPSFPAVFIHTVIFYLLMSWIIAN